MVFSSMEFLFRFLPLFLLIYFVTKPKYRNVVLLLGSLVFYAYGEPIYVFLMMFSIIFNYSVARRIKRFYDIEVYSEIDCSFERNCWLAVAMVFDFGMLFIFKYINFFIEIINTAAGTKIFDSVAITLPLGISFYTFQITSYIFDVYRLKYQADKMYPELRETGAAPLDRETKKHIFKNVTGLTVSNLCGIALTSADNILISAFISVGTVGVYGNYLTLKKYISRLMDTLFGSIAAGIGDVCAGEDTEKKEHLFRVLQFTYFWLYGFTAICFWHLYNVFIAGVWLHDTKWLLPDAAVALIVINYLLDGLNGAVYKYRVACGLHWEVKYRHLFSAIFNVFISYALMGPCGLGVTGVLLGTTASILIMISFDPYLIYKKVFKKSSIPYYLSYIGYLALIATTCALVSLLCAPFSEYNVLHCLIRLAICLIVPNGVWFILFRKSPSFLFLWDKMYKLLGSVKRKVSDGRKDNEQ